MDTQLRLLDAAALPTDQVDLDHETSHVVPASTTSGDLRVRVGRARRTTTPRPPRTTTTWRLSAETRATGRRGIAQARAALQSAHRTDATPSATPKPRAA